MKAWLFTSKTGETSWQSNTGYDDVLGSQYSYDSGVAYHLQVQAGDTVLIREDDVVMGISRIDQIEKKEGKKLRRRCPTCRRTGIEHRKRAGHYVCTHKKCGARFPEPLDVYEPVTEYVARYGTQWQALDGAIAYSQLEPWLSGVAQNAIRPCDLDGIVDLLTGVSVALPEATAPVPPLPIPGGRRRTEIKARLGQGAFRTALLRKYGLSCAVTGPCPAEALEAAHLVPFARHETHDVDSGLLLRSDIHRLLDAGALAINPDTKTVELTAELLNYPMYRDLHGRTITQNPSAAALHAAYGLAQN
ncbi:HNH endonuclease [Rhodococcus rhodochrous]|uniref:HNH endonuclease n=1 Tax=Rhodococcus rhodochrous TaxID=1829 RepID=UPI000E747963